MLCGTKLDLRGESDEKTIVTTEKGENFCMNQRLFEFVETSAKAFENLTTVFEAAVNAVLMKRDHLMQSILLRDQT